MNDSGFARSDGADIAYQVHGTGPLLLLIAGSDGDSCHLANLAHRLAVHYTVVRYDRRAYFRSSGDPTSMLNMAQQARDACAVINDMGMSPAAVFGTDAGANIALKLAEDWPAAVSMVIAHEPVPATVMSATLGERTLARALALHRPEQGAEPTHVLFTDPAERAAYRIRRVETTHGKQRFKQYESDAVSAYTPNPIRLQRTNSPIFLAYGIGSGSTQFVQAAHRFGALLARPVQRMSGHHRSFATQPEIFAFELHSILQEGLQAPSQIRLRAST